MKIALIAKKGGVGKSTLSLLLHEAFRQAGKTAAIWDWDSQGTSNKSLDLIAGTKAKAGQTYDYLIYDTPPSLAHVATATAVQNADLVFVVTSPSPADVWEAKEAATFAREKNPNAKVFLVFNKVRPRTLLSKSVEESAKQADVPMFPKMLCNRECYQHAIVGGWKALDSAAKEEVFEWALAVA